MSEPLKTRHSREGGNPVKYKTPLLCMDKPHKGMLDKKTLDSRLRGNDVVEFLVTPS